MTDSQIHMTVKLVWLLVSIVFPPKSECPKIETIETLSLLSPGSRSCDCVTCYILLGGQSEPRLLGRGHGLHLFMRGVSKEYGGHVLN
jgi:hypothetical protein